ncbi:MAG: carbohydrate binding domain-containing protein, partial [Ignavibacteriaceae bacterium]
DIKSISFSANQAQNGDFSNAFSYWILIGDTINPFHPEDTGSAKFSVEGGMAAIDISNQGTGIWSIMLYQKVSFVKDAAYRISFDAKADHDVEIISNVCRDGGDWAVFSGDHKFRLTSAIQNYSYEFKMSAGGISLFQFCLGYVGTGKLYFDNVVITKL